MYRIKSGLLVNADSNASANILRKVSTKLRFNLSGVSTKDLLFSEAETEDGVGEGIGYVSRNLDYLGLVVDSGNAVLELDENNNFNRAQGLDLDHITHFP